MRGATALGVAAAGAILAFAVDGHPSFINIQIAGWVVMLTGVAGLLLPRRGYGRVRRRRIYRRAPARPKPERIGAIRYRPHLMLNPAANPPAPVEAPGDSDRTGHRAAPDEGDNDTIPILTEDVGEEVWDQ